MPLSQSEDRTLRPAAQRATNEPLRKRVRLFLADQRWLIVGLLSLSVFILGYIGMRKHFAAVGLQHSQFDPFYRVLQLFFFDDSVLDDTSNLPWQLELARLLAPLITTLMAGTALISLFREKFQLVRLRFMKGHVVICGLGQTGLQLANEFARGGEKVIAIEIDNTLAAVDHCRDEGITVLNGDATESRLLRKSRVHRARYLIAVCGKDGTNIETALQAQRSMRGRRNLQANDSGSPAQERKWFQAGGRLECFVHIENPELRNLVSQSGLSLGDRGPDSVKFFNTPENAARALLREFPPDCEEPFGSKSAHATIIGFGALGESLLMHAARIGHYRHGKRLSVTVIDKDATRKEKSCRLRYPQLDQVCDARFLALDTEDPELITGDFLPIDGTSASLHSVYVCEEDDARALRCSLNLLPAIEGRCAQLVVCVRQKGGVASLLEQLAASRGALRIEVFQIIEFACAREIVLNERLDVLAKAIHQTYLDHHRVDVRGRGAGNYGAEWYSLPEEIRESNRQQADHIPIKLRAIGCHTEPAGTPGVSAFRFTPEEVETLARMEHARWKAERLLSGWTQTRMINDARKRSSPYLIDWNDLPADVKEYNRQAVRDIPAFLAQVDLGIAR